MVEWMAAAGERNELSVTLDQGTVILRDAAAPIVAGRGCTNAVDGSVTCSTGSLVVWAEDGDDTVTVTTATSAGIVGISGGDGDDTIALVGPVSTGSGVGQMPRGIRGDAGDDVLSAGSTGAGLYGDGGDDTLVGGPGSDTMEGGLGDDVLSGEGGNDEIAGSPGTDILSGGEGDDELSGTGAISYYPSGGVRAPNSIDGGPGDDTLQGDLGDDRLDGGDGSDTVQYAARMRPVVVDLGSGAGGGAGEHDMLLGIENAEGGYAPDTLIGDGAANRLEGEVYDPSILPIRLQHKLVNELRRGDRILGGEGDDLLVGGVALDHPGTIAGGEGDDTVRWTGATAVDGGPGDDLLDGAELPQHSAGRLACGDGADRVEAPNRRDVVGPDCEAITTLGLQLSGRVLDAGGLTFAAARVKGAGPYARACGVSATVTGAGARRLPLAVALARLPRSGPRTLRLRRLERRRLGPRVGVTLRIARCPRGAPAMRLRDDSEATAAFLLRR